jgi:hypothetical protein
MVFSSDFHCAAPDTIRPTIIFFSYTRPQRWCNIYHPRCASTSLEASLENRSLTCFQAKQAGRFQRVSNVVLLLPSVLCRNQQTIARFVLRLKPRNHRGDFMGQITKWQLPVLRPKLGNPPTLVLRQNQETCVLHLLVHDVDRTQRYPTSRSSGHRVLNLCLTIPGHLHQVSYSCLDPRRCPPCRTCHLHIMRQANTFLHTNW